LEGRRGPTGLCSSVGGYPPLGGRESGVACGHPQTSRPFRGPGGLHLAGRMTNICFDSCDRLEITRLEVMATFRQVGVSCLLAALEGLWNSR